MSPLLHIVADENIPCVENLFSKLGQVRLLPGRKISNDDLRHADVLLVRSVTRVDEELLQNTAVKLVGSATIGVDHVDQDYLEARSISFCWAPGSNARSVVEYVISSIWALREKLGTIRNKRLAIIGYGNVGRLLAKVATELGLKVEVCDPLVAVDPRFPFVTFEQALGADIISFHTPLTVDTDYPTRHMLNAAKLSLIRSGTMLINTSRGAVVDNQALLNRLEQKRDLLTVMDVWENEPVISQRLMSLVDIATPHIAGYSLDGKLAGVKAVYKGLRQFPDVFLDVLLDVDAEIPDLPLPAVAPLDLIKTEDRESLLDGLFAGAYNITADDQRMRRALNGRTESEAAEAFDFLRKSYPIRREWHGHTVATGGLLTNDQWQSLEQLGFRLTV